MSVINTNVKSLVAQQSLSVNERKMSTTMERLSTGNRINSAADDAAGLAISSRMDSQIRGLGMAMRNANDGISLLQTAEGAMSEVTSMLQRMRELSVQSVNGVNNDSDRAALDAEVQQLVAEIDRIATTTQFNGINLVDGSFGKKTLQIGNLANQTMAVGMQDVRSTTLGSDSAAAVTAFGIRAADAATLVTNGALSAGNLQINGVSIGGTLATDDLLSMDAKAASAIAKVAAINRLSEQTGVKATVGQTVAEGASMTAGAAVAANVVTINGVATANFETVVDLGTSRDNVVAAINAISDQTGVTAINTGSDKGGVQLIAADGRNITVAKTTAATAALTGLADAGVQSGTFNLTSIDGNPITISSETAAPSTLAKSGLNAGSFASGQASFTTSVRANAAATAGLATVGKLEQGDLSINGVSIAAAVAADDTASSTLAQSSSKSQSAIAVAAAINKSSADTGVTAKANANVLVGTGFTAGASVLTLNGVSITAATADDTRATLVTKINTFSGQTGVVAEDNGNGLTLTAADGRNISIGAATGAAVGLTGVTLGVVGAATEVTHYASVTLSSAKAFTIDRATNANTNMKALGFTAGSFGGDGDGGRLSEVSIATAADATQAIGVVDSAIQTISTARSDLGAKQNRLDYTVNNLSTMVTNTSASQSRIRDTDYAVETTNLARSQIIQQAATAMLAQANQQPSGVLALLQ